MKTRVINHTEPFFDLTRQMNKKTVHETSANGFIFKSEILMGLESDKVSFTEGSGKLAPSTKPLDGKSKLQIGKRTILQIDNLTGEVTALKKPFFVSWKKTLKKADEAIKFLLQNINNPEAVKKRIIRIQGFTEDGFKKLKNIK